MQKAFLVQLTSSPLAEKCCRLVKLASEQRNIYLLSCGYFCFKLTFASPVPLSLLSDVFSLLHINFYVFQNIDLKEVEVEDLLQERKKTLGICGCLACLTFEFSYLLKIKYCLFKAQKWDCYKLILHSHRYLGQIETYFSSWEMFYRSP